MYGALWDEELQIYRTSINLENQYIYEQSLGTYEEYLESKVIKEKLREEFYRTMNETPIESELRQEGEYRTEMGVRAAYNKKLDNLVNEVSKGLDFHYQYERERYPLGDEVGFVHPDLKASMLIRNTNTIDIFTSNQSGLRLDYETDSLQTAYSNTQHYGDNWAGIFREHFALETEGHIYSKGSSIFTKARDILKGKSKNLFSSMTLGDMVNAGKRFFLRAKTLVSIKVILFSVWASDFRFNVSVNNIGIRGHYLDDKVLYTQEMYEDILKIHRHFLSQTTLYNMHTHISTFGPTSTPLPTFPTPPVLGVYTDPLVKPWPSSEPDLPNESKEDIENLEEEKWEFLSQSYWNEEE